MTRKQIEDAVLSRLRYLKKYYNELLERAWCPIEGPLVKARKRYQMLRAAIKRYFKGMAGK